MRRSRVRSIEAAGGRRVWLAIGVWIVLGTQYAVLSTLSTLSAADSQPAGVAADVDRSPVDLRLGPDETWLVTANETSNSIALVELPSGKVLDERACGKRPAAIALTRDGKLALVSCRYGGEVCLFEIADGRLNPNGAIEVGFEPHGVAVSADGQTAYVAQTAAAKVAVMDLTQRKVVAQIDVDLWPRHVDLSPDGSRLAVGCNGSGSIAVIDTAKREMLYSQPLDYGINIGQLQTSADGQHVYFPWMMYRSNSITASNIRLGWVLASKLARVRLDGPEHRQAISLDVPGKAAADPHGIAISPDGRRMVCSSAGTHELFLFRLPDVPFVGVGGPGDLIDRRLLADSDLFTRIPTGGRPLAVRFSRDNRTVYVANYLENSVQIVDISQRQVVAAHKLGGPAEPSLVRQGAIAFFDAENSLDQWYSCHSCHQDGGINSKPMDTFNDGTASSLKTVLPLYQVGQTAPWTWHGWQTDLRDAIYRSMTITMLGPKPSEEKIEVVLRYLETLEPPPNPYRGKDGSLSAAALRGEKVFASPQAGCIDCHSGPYFTDGQVHDVGLGSATDKYRGFNTPSLLGVHRKVRLLHDGRKRTLEQILTGPHDPKTVVGGEGISEQERQDLIEYLKSL